METFFKKIKFNFNTNITEEPKTLQDDRKAIQHDWQFLVDDADILESLYKEIKMKRNSKRRHPFVLVKALEIQQPDVCKEPGKEEFVALFQSPKCPEKYAWFWALKIVRDWLRKNNIPFEKWNDYIIYPVHRFNCSQFNYPTNEQFYDHIHAADNDKEDDEATIKWYNEIKSKWRPTIK